MILFLFVHNLFIISTVVYGRFYEQIMNKAKTFNIINNFHRRQKIHFYLIFPILNTAKELYPTLERSCVYRILKELHLVKLYNYELN